MSKRAEAVAPKTPREANLRAEIAIWKARAEAAEALLAEQVGEARARWLLAKLRASKAMAVRG